MLKFLATPFIYIYVWLFKLRLKVFGYDVEYQYLPKQIAHFYLPVHMDFFWFKRGFYGLNKCLVPDGTPNSKRFDHTDPYYQTWIGTYYLNEFFHRKFKGDLEKVVFLSQAAIEDQNTWLESYGAIKPQSHTIKSSITLVKEVSSNNHTKRIYYGEMMTEVEDCKENTRDHKFIHWFSVLAGKIYSKQEINLDLLQKDHRLSPKKKIHLFGYYSIIELGKKYLITYVCGTLENKEKINSELLKIIYNAKLVKV